MTFFDYIDRNPWWSMVYLNLICLSVWFTVAILKDWVIVRVENHDNSKRGDYVDCNFEDIMVDKEDPSRN